MLKIVLYSVSAVLGLLLLFFLHLKWSFWEPSDVPKGSLVYRLKIPGDVKAFPTWSPIDTPLYNIRIADGLSSSWISMRYESASSIENLLEQAKKSSLECEQTQARLAARCEKAGPETSIVVTMTKQGDDNTSRVDIDFSGY